MVHADGDPKVREIPFQVCLIGEKEASSILVYHPQNARAWVFFRAS